MPWSVAQQVVLAITPKISATFSFFGSWWIIVEVVSDSNKLQNVYHRILLAMSVYDALGSVWNFGSTWPIPRGTANIYGAIGTTQTCVAQGFFLQLGLAVPIYNAFLSVYYLLVVRYEMTEETLREKLETKMHLVTTIITFGTAIAGLFLNLYNNANLWCWIAPFPPSCLDSWRYGDKKPCKRGDNAWIYRWAFYFAPLWFCILSSIVATALVCYSVWRREYVIRQAINKSNVRNASFEHGDSGEGDDCSDESSTRRDFRGSNERPTRPNHSGGDKVLSVSERNLSELDEPNSNTNSPTDNSRSRAVLYQSLWYLGAFCSTHFFSTVNRILQQTLGTSYFVLILFHSILDPLEGFLNFLVYCRPRYLRQRHRQPEMKKMACALYILRWSFMGAPKNPKVEMNSITGRKVLSQDVTEEQDTNTDSLCMMKNSDVSQVAGAPDANISQPQAQTNRYDSMFLEDDVYDSSIRGLFVEDPYQSDRYHDWKNVIVQSDPNEESVGSGDKESHTSPKLVNSEGLNAVSPNRLNGHYAWTQQQDFKGITRQTENSLESAKRNMPMTEVCMPMKNSGGDTALYGDRFVEESDVTSELTFDFDHGHELDIDRRLIGLMKGEPVYVPQLDRVAESPEHSSLAGHVSQVKKNECGIYSGHIIPVGNGSNNHDDEIGSEWSYEVK